MKKVIATVLTIGIVMMPLPAFAQDQTTNISFTSLDSLVRANNPTIKTLDNTVESTRGTFNLNRENLENTEVSTEGNLEKSISDLSDQIDLYTSLKDTYLNGSVDSGENPYNTIIDSLTAEKEALIIQKESIDYTDMYDRLDQTRNDTLKAVIISANMGKDAQVYTAQALYMAYLTLQQTIKENNITLQSLNDQLKILKLYKELGLATDSSVRSIQTKFDTLQNVLSDLAEQLESIKGSLNLALGQSYDTELDIDQAVLTVDNDVLGTISYNDDLAKAKENSYTIRVQNNAYITKSHEYDNAEEDYGKNSNATDKARIDEDTEKIKLEDVQRKLDSHFAQTHQVVFDKQKVLAIEEQSLQDSQVQLDQGKLQYNVGLISKKEFDGIQQNYDKQLIAVDKAKQDLFKAYNDYEWLVKGFDTVGNK